MSDPLGQLREEMEEVLHDPELDDTSRAVKLRALRDGMRSLLGVANTYYGDLSLRQAGSGSAVRNRLQARAKADMREAAIESGIFTAEQLDSLGMWSHEELDNLAEEGLLESVLSAEFERLHWRNRKGKWINTPDRAQPKQATKAPQEQRYEKTDEPKEEEGLAEPKDD